MLIRNFWPKMAIFGVDFNSSIYLGGILNSHHHDQHAKYYGNHSNSEGNYESGEILGSLVHSANQKAEDYKEFQWN